MDKSASDRPVLQHIDTLVQEEHALHEKKGRSDRDQQRLDAIQVELDQCWDLLRQRRALREFGQDPGAAHVRPKDIVEGYEQ